MPYMRETALDFNDLISKVIEWVTDTNIHGADAWELIRNEPWPRGTILKAHGFQDGEHFYIGLMAQAFEKGKTYTDWFFKTENVGKYFVWSQDGLNLPRNPFTLLTPRSVVVQKKPLFHDSTLLPDTYTFEDIEIFKASSRALFMGVFKQYSAGLDWHEQPGGMTFDNFKTRQIFVSDPSGRKISYRLPLYPGVGYPAIGMDFDGPLNGYLDFWVTKDAHRMMLVVRNREFWDVGYMGLIEPYHSKMQYSFPAAVIGGTSGATMTGETLSNGLPYLGVRFDYSTANMSLIRGIPTFPATATDENSALSYVRVMLPDGCWQSVSNWTQGVKSIPHEAGTGSGYYYVFKPPERAKNIEYYIRPTCTSLENVSHVLRPLGDICTYQMEPLEFIEAKPSVKNMLGKVWRMYWPSQRIAEYGEIKIGGKMFLMLPNSWEGRPWHIYDGKTDVYSPQDLLAQQKTVEAISKQMNCLIRLED